MSDDQYQSVKSTNSEPTEYIYHYAGQNINVTFISSLEGGVSYNFVIFPRTNPVFIYSEGMVTEHQSLKKQLDVNYLVLDLVTTVILLLIAINPYLEYRHSFYLIA